MYENCEKILIGFDKVGEDLYREIDCIIKKLKIYINKKKLKYLDFFREKGNEIND